MSLKNISLFEWAILVLMILIGLASRFYLAEQWNVKPVAAMILFGGFFFRHWWLPMIGAVAVMALSDMRLGMYDLTVMGSVYFSLAIAALLGRMLRQYYGTKPQGFGWIASFAGASVLMSTIFYVITNGACWIGSAWYPQTWQGLVNCYVAAIPFFQRTLLGDFCSTMVLVGAYAFVLAYQRSYSANRHQASEAVPIDYR